MKKLIIGLVMCLYCPTYAPCDTVKTERPIDILKTKENPLEIVTNKEKPLDLPVVVRDVINYQCIIEAKVHTAMAEFTRLGKLAKEMRKNKEDELKIIAVYRQMSMICNQLYPIHDVIYQLYPKYVRIFLLLENLDVVLSELGQ
jgi:hypothetical protein